MNTPLSAFGVARNSSFRTKSFENFCVVHNCAIFLPSGGVVTMSRPFFATSNADSGVFIRQPQLQCRDYPLAGPYKNLTKYKAQDWNEMIVAVTNNVGYCTCNGEVLEAAFKLPATGGIGLEGDRGQMEYRRIRLQEIK